MSRLSASYTYVLTEGYLCYFYRERKTHKLMMPKPIFIIGSYRSGTSILTWALGQHSNIFPLEETNWIYRLGVYLDCLYSFGSVNGEFSNLSSMRITRANFYRSFGEHINSLLLDNRVNYLKASLKAYLQKENSPRLVDLKNVNTMEEFAEYTKEDDSFLFLRSRDDVKDRWVDGTPENSHFVYCLNMMFPKAKFIFLIRNPIEVANSLMNFATAGGQAGNYEEESAYNQWFDLTESCYYALKAFGTDKVFLVKHQDLVNQKEKVIKECLVFLGEEYDANCLKPFQVVINSSKYDRTKIDFSIENGIKSAKKYVSRACLFYTQVLADPFYRPKGGLYFYRLLRERYLKHAKHFYG